MNNILKRLLLKIIDDLDSGNSSIDLLDEDILIEFLQKYIRKDYPMSKYLAYNYLNVSRATFDNYVKDHKIPDGKKVQGFKEKLWFRKDLDNYIKQCKLNNKQHAQYNSK